MSKTSILKKLRGIPWLFFTVKDGSKYDGRLSAYFRKMSYDHVNKRYRIMYTVSEIQGDAQQLFELVTEYWEANKKLTMN
ncbi:hypothetical protein [Sphingobacterium sp. LRF_L2]|uniref:hypothetical protein n=1 Tax=Sphingobacterium sp. LRF_L2 TaxID=3369421 RepID=UPI003F61357A